MTEFDTPQARALIQDAVASALRDNREWLRELIQDALLEMADAEARREADLRVGEPQPFPLPHGRA